MNRTLTAAGALIALLPLPVLAQDTQASALAKFGSEFAATDTNKDGFLTRAEMKARIVKMSAGKQKIDAVHADRLAGLWMDRADTNKDGKASKAEAQTLFAAVLTRYRADRAGRAVGGGSVGTKAGPVDAPAGR